MSGTMIQRPGEPFRRAEYSVNIHNKCLVNKHHSLLFEWHPMSFNDEMLIDGYHRLTIRSLPAYDCKSLLHDLKIADESLLNNSIEGNLIGGLASSTNCI